MFFDLLTLPKRDLQIYSRVDIDTCPSSLQNYPRPCRSAETANHRERAIETQPKGIFMPFTTLTKTTRKEKNYV